MRTQAVPGWQDGGRCVDEFQPRHGAVMAAIPARWPHSVGEELPRRPPRTLGPGNRPKSLRRAAPWTHRTSVLPGTMDDPPIGPTRYYVIVCHDGRVSTSTRSRCGRTSRAWNSEVPIDRQDRDVDLIVHRRVRDQKRGERVDLRTCPFRVGQTPIRSQGPQIANVNPRLA